MTSKKLKLILPCGFLIMMFLYISDYSSLKYQMNLQLRKGTGMNKINDLKYILLYTSFFESTTWYLGELGQEPFANCRTKNCHLTKDHYQLSNVSMFDAILFHIHNMHNVDLPDQKSRHPNQVSFMPPASTQVKFFYVPS